MRPRSIALLVTQGFCVSHPSALAIGERLIYKVQPGRILEFDTIRCSPRTFRRSRQPSGWGGDRRRMTPTRTSEDLRRPGSFSGIRSPLYQKPRIRVTDAENQERIV